MFVFGNFSDRESAVSHAARSNRGYRALGELNTQPAIVYLSKVTLHEPVNGGHEPAGHGTPEGAAGPGGGDHGDGVPAKGGGTESMPQGGQSEGGH